MVIDHYSRRVMGIATFATSPSSTSMQVFPEGAIDTAAATPKYIVSDKGQQFWGNVFKDWCDRKDITPRFGAVGQHGSIALVERFILTLKNECTRRVLVTLRKCSFFRKLVVFAEWFNEYRSHSGLSGNTPHEIYDDRTPASQRPRWEPRSRW